MMTMSDLISACYSSGQSAYNWAMPGEKDEEIN